MSLRFVDGYDHYNPSADLGLKYTTTNTGGNFFGGAAQGTGRFSGFCLKTRSWGHFIVFAASQPSWTIGFAFKFDSIAMLPVGVMSFSNAFAPQITIYLDSAGRLNIGQGSSQPPTIINTGASKTGSNALVAGTWYYVEAQVVLTGSNLTACSVQLNGVSEITWTGTKAISAIDSILISDYSNNTGNISAFSYYDDLYILDGSGSLNTTFLGDQRVETIYPSAAGALTQWTASSGSNYAAVNTAGSQDGDTTYVKTATVGVIDTYTMGNLASTPTVVSGVVLSTIARKDDAGTRTFCAVVRPASTNYVNGNVNALNSTYKCFQDIFELNPATSTAWTGTSINAMEAGVKLLS